MSKIQKHCCTKLGTAFRILSTVLALDVILPVTFGLPEDFVHDSELNCWELPSGLRCVFKNACWDGGKLIVAGPGSNLRKNFEINLSGIPHHSAMNLHYSFFGLDTIESDYEIFTGKYFLMKRFLPNNLMHILHDDVLPLLRTLEVLENEAGIANSDEDISQSISVLFADSYELESPYHNELYSELTAGSTVHISDLRQDLEKEVVCFEEIITGLSNETLWYQYGFDTPQGPIHAGLDTKNHFLIPSTVKKLRTLLSSSTNPVLSDDKTKNEVHSKCEAADQKIQNEDSNYCHKNDDLGSGEECSMRKVAVLFSRKENRIILNEAQLAQALEHQLRLQVKIVSAETHSLREMVGAVSEAEVLIGMHGSLLSFLLFSDHSKMIILELFPYAVPPENYTPYKTIAGILGLRYISWRNPFISKSVPHPEHPKDLGGLVHLPAKERERIEKSEEVPQHLCCSDPEFLYRIYQDTIVDVDDVLAILKSN